MKNSNNFYLEFDVIGSVILGGSVFFRLGSAMARESNDGVRNNIILTYQNSNQNSKRIFDA